MPYITQADRLKFDAALEQLPPAETKGELNYLITKLMIQYLMHHGMSYTTLSDISNTPEEAAAEFRRRVTASYEDSKIDANGDVYPPFSTIPKAAGTSPK